MRNFTATVKEREEGAPCFVVIESDGEASGRHPVLEFPAGTGIRDAQEIARLLNSAVSEIRIGLLPQ